MSYIEESLSGGETIEGVFRLHWTSWLWVWLWVVLAIPTLGITLLVALYVFLQLKYRERGVTNKRVRLTQVPRARDCPRRLIWINLAGGWTG
ncbi:MAG TPA: hypothetical protein VJ789_07325 [Burkholderiales bacterium]|nr:hypothetical protein [Burkholderiales bacterium]